MRTRLGLHRRRFLNLLWSAAAASVVAIAAVACGHVPPHLTLPTLKIGDPAFAATITGYTEAPIVAGNRINVLLNGDEIFPAKLKLIKDATKTINYAQYVFEEGPARRRRRARAGRALPGRRPGQCAGRRCRRDGDARRAAPDHDRGGVPRRDVPPAPALHARHPPTTAIIAASSWRTGGSASRGDPGTSGKWSGNGRTEGQWRDTDVRIEGPVVLQLQGAFVENWLEATGVALGGDDYFPRRSGSAWSP